MDTHAWDDERKPLTPGPDGRPQAVLNFLSVKRRTMLIWFRLGDNDEYASYEDIDKLAACMVWCLLDDADNIKPRPDGFEYPDVLVGNNYASLYWGDEEADKMADFNDYDALKAAILREKCLLASIDEEEGE